MMKVKGKRETAPVLTPTAACSADPCSSGDERSRERSQGGGREIEEEGEDGSRREGRF